jgi:SH3-like domain-containing protein
LENAKKACDTAGPAYSVYDSTGKKVYPESKIEPVKPEPTPIEPAPVAKLPYLVKITASVLNVRAGAGQNYKIKTQVRKNEVYTIIAEDGNWGKLKSGAGWICLDYVKKV